MDDIHYTVEQIAEKLALDKSKVYLLIHTGQLRASNVSTGKLRPNWRISASELNRFMEERESGRE